MVSAVLPLDSIPPGELPPPAPRACFGRDELIERIVCLAENLTPFALIGPGGIGKTSIALTVLHHDRIKGQFGNDRWFIRCDRFPASLNRFLSQLSRVTGAGIENPEDLTPLRPFLSSRKMIIFLDNAESLLDPQGTDAREIYTVVEELSQFETICLGITSRISIIPRYCKRLVIPTLSLQSACDTFYDIYDNGSRSDIIGNLLKQLDFHALSIVSLATIASQNMWNYGRLAREWNAYHTEILQKDHNEGLTTTIELSLASPTFRELGPIARDVLGVVAFFPQGINENSLDWLFPTIPDRSDVFNKLSVLSLTHQRDGFITMLAPFRDYLRPKDPTSFPLLHAVKEQYFSRLSVHVDPDKPGFEEARWITSEDENVEHLLNVFTSTDVNSASAWDACAYFMRHLSWHKPRLVVLGPKIEGLPDDHRSKPRCLFELSRLFDSVGHFVQGKRLLTHTLNLWKERGDDLQVAQTLRFLSNTNRLLGLHKEGIAQAEEAFGIYERFDNVVGQAQSLQHLAWLLYGDNQLDAAETAASQAIDLFLSKGEQFLVCRCYRALGNICQSMGKTEEAIDHFETALRLGFPFSWHDEQSRNHYSLARLFLGENRFDNARVHVERAKSYALNDPYLLGCAMELQARLWYKQRRLKDAKSEALRATDTFERLGATKELKYCRRILRNIAEETKRPVTSYESDSTGELLEKAPLPTPTNSPFLVRGTGR